MGGPARLKYLLDTHIWLWSVVNPKRLGAATLKLVKDQENELWLSPMSAWEALTLHYKRRIKFDREANAWLAHATAGLKEAPLTYEIMLEARGFPLHQDPADRIIAATSIILDLILVTADERLLGLGNIKTFANR